MQTLTHTFVPDHTKIGSFLSEIRSAEDRVEKLGSKQQCTVQTQKLVYISISIKIKMWYQGTR